MKSEELDEALWRRAAWVKRQLEEIRAGLWSKRRDAEATRMREELLKQERDGSGQNRQ